MSVHVVDAEGGDVPDGVRFLAVAMAGTEMAKKVITQFAGSMKDDRDKVGVLMMISTGVFAAMLRATVEDAPDTAGALMTLINDEVVDLLAQVQKLATEQGE
jgi:(p)ppGpp synthase/HD superfamily hydrolase